MKRLVFTIIPVLICGIWFATSCNKENNADSALNFKAVGYLGGPTTRSYLAEGGRTIDTLLFKGDNIEWFNATTREIKFKNPGNTGVHFGLYGGLMSLIVCLDETELFSLGSIAGISSTSYDHPVLINFSPDIGYGATDIVLEYRIGRGYPDWEYWTEEFWTETNWDRTADWVKEREKNWEAIEKGWNKFIEQLKKEGKYRQ
jgi:hypothetical protein